MKSQWGANEIMSVLRERHDDIQKYKFYSAVYNLRKALGSDTQGEKDETWIKLCRKITIKKYEVDCISKSF